jgi:hypothetical protein
MRSIASWLCAGEAGQKTAMKKHRGNKKTPAALQ